MKTKKKPKTPAHIATFRKNLKYAQDMRDLDIRYIYTELNIAYATWSSWFHRDCLPGHKMWPEIERVFQLPFWMLLHPKMPEILDHKRGAANQQ